MPLSFREYLHFKNVIVSRKKQTEWEEAKIKKHLIDYLKTGGFPDVVLAEEKETILSQLFTDIVSRGVLSRAGIRKENILDEFSYYLSSNVSNLLSFNNMNKYFTNRGIKISVPTLLNYFWHLKNAFLFFDSLIYSYKVKDQMQYPRKIYCIDNGIVNLAGFKTSEKFGRLYENTVAIELLRKGYNLFYWKARNQVEVDFVIKQGTQITQLIQVCYDIENTDVKQREVKALYKAMETFNLKEGLVITEKNIGEQKIDGRKIVYKPLWKWLINF